MSARIEWATWVSKAESNRLEVLSEEPSRFSLRSESIRLRCYCGVEFEAAAAPIWIGKRRSCGCLHREMIALTRRSDTTYSELVPKLKSWGFELLSQHDPAERLIRVTRPGAHLFRCHCGQAFGEKTTLKALLSGNTMSCGCLRWRRKNEEQQARSKNARWKIGLEAQRIRNRKSLYGVSQEQYDAMVQRQGGTCELCKGPPVGRPFLCVDHDHSTGKVRALLCARCNQGLGQFKDSPELLEAAAAYLRSHGRGLRLREQNQS